MMTPLPVPIHRRLHDTMRAVILTKEKPSFPVPAEKGIKDTFKTKSECFVCVSLRVNTCVMNGPSILLT